MLGRLTVQARDLGSTERARYPTSRSQLYSFHRAPRAVLSGLVLFFLQTHYTQPNEVEDYDVACQVGKTCNIYIYIYITTEMISPKQNIITTTRMDKVDNKEKKEKRKTKLNYKHHYIYIDKSTRKLGAFILTQPTNFN